MPLNVNNPEADALTRKFARMAGVGIKVRWKRRRGFAINMGSC
jgi:hypothetical protein